MFQWVCTSGIPATWVHELQQAPAPMASYFNSSLIHKLIYTTIDPHPNSYINGFMHQWAHTSTCAPPCKNKVTPGTSITTNTQLDSHVPQPLTHSAYVIFTALQSALRSRASKCFTNQSCLHGSVVLALLSMTHSFMACFSFGSANTQTASFTNQLWPTLPCTMSYGRPQYHYGSAKCQAPSKI